MSETQDSTKSQENLRLWLQVEQTHPDYVRGFTGNDGFNGTGINPTYLVMKATEMFGPIGIGWGYDIVKEEYVKGAPLGFDAEGNMYGTVLVHIVCLKFWYLTKDGKRGEATHFGGTTFVGKGDHGIFTDEDAPKKSITDALGKCMSMAGFSADVYLGRYDDHKYVARMQEHFKDKSMTGTPTLTALRPARASVEGSQNATAAVSSSEPQAQTTAKASDPEAWIAKVQTFNDDGQLDHARKEAGRFLKGENLKTVRAAIDDRQYAVWLTRIPVLSKANLPKMREKAPQTFSDEEKLQRIIAALDARQASFAALTAAAA
jgi:hypothetical protein